MAADATDAMWSAYLERIGAWEARARDAAYCALMDHVRDMLRKLAVILEDEGVPPAQRERILRCLLYGAPGPAEAEERMREMEANMKLAMSMPPLQVRFPGDGR